MRGTLDNYKEAIYYTTNFAKDSDQFTSNSNGITGFIAGSYLYNLFILYIFSYILYLYSYNK